jgi:rhodanese-related sulfurtransferase
VLLLVSCNQDDKTAAIKQTTKSTESAAAGADIATVQPAELTDLLAKGEKPLLLHVGFKKLYEQAHIPGSEYFGPTSETDALARLEQRVASTPKESAIILYCGCCPWERCPNVKPAFRALHDQGFTNVRVLFITKDFGTDWADKSYPVAAGE